MCNVDCPHINDCTNANTYWCETCANNRNHKHNYYRKVPDCTPWYPTYPNYSYWPYVTWTTSTSPNMTTPTTSNYFTPY